MSKIEQIQGLAFSFIAYILWGFFPYVFHFLGDLHPFVICVHRAFWSLIFSFLFLFYFKKIPILKKIFFDKKSFLILIFASTAILTNWLSFTWAVYKKLFFQISLGYFLSPIISVLFAILIYKETLSFYKKYAILFALLSIFNELYWSGGISFISLLIAFSFGIYGVIKKKLKTDALVSLNIEFLFIFGIIFSLSILLKYQKVNIESIFVYETFKLVLLMIIGFLTLIPLFCYFEAVKRLKLITVSLMFYITPSVQFILAIFILKQKFDFKVFLSFLFIWLSLLIYLFDSYITNKNLKILEK